MLHYQDSRPDPRLKRYIKYYGQIIVPELKAERQEFVPPSAGKGLIFWDFSREPIRINNGVFQQRIPSSFIMGQGNKPSKWRHRGGLKGFAVIFHPGQLTKFLEAPWSEVMDALISIESYHDDGLKLLSRQISEHPTFSARCKLTNTFFLQRLNNINTTLSRADKMLWLLQSHPGTSIHQLAKAAHCSERHFNRVLTQKFGISPKAYQNLQRIHLAIGHLYQSPDTKFTDLAHSLGFSDQSHFIRHFQRYLGQSPGAFVQHLHKSVNIKSSGLESKLLMEQD